MMAIEKIGKDGFMITGDDIQVFDLIRIQKGLSLEVRTGMKMSRGISMVKVAQDRVTNVLGLKTKLPRSKAKALEVFTKILTDNGVLQAS
jgi:hypothetical protein